MKLPRILQIGGTERNIGKTLLACKILKHFSQSHTITAVKISIVDDMPPDSPVKEYRNFGGNYVLTEELANKENSNSFRYLESGATRAFWLRSRKDFIKDAFAFTLKTIGPHVPIICESNHLRNFIHPGVFIMLHKNDPSVQKDSSTNILSLADLLIDAEKNLDSFNPDLLIIHKKEWSLKMQ